MRTMKKIRTFGYSDGTDTPTIRLSDTQIFRQSEPSDLSSDVSPETLVKGETLA